MCLQIGNVCYCCSEAYGAICGAICEGMSFLFMNNPFSVSRLFFGPFLSFLREQNEQKKANKNAHLHYMPSSTSELWRGDQCVLMPPFYRWENWGFSSVQLLSHVRLFATPWTAARQASLSITNSRSSLKLTSIESVMPSSHLILCHPLFLLPPISPSIRVFSDESTLRMRWPKYWSFSFSIIPS